MRRIAVLEKDFQAVVIKLARQLGWMVAHFSTLTQRQMSAEAKGFPDLVLVHEATGAIVFAELKRDGGKVKPEQVRWHEALNRDVRGSAVIWRPEDLDEITVVLSNPRRLLRGEHCGHL